MQKNNNYNSNFPGNLFVNTINLALITLNKSYKSILERTSRKYIVLNRENLNKNAKVNIPSKNKTVIRMVKEVKQEIGPFNKLIENTLVNSDIASSIKPTNTISKEINDYLQKKFASLNIELFLKRCTVLADINGETTITNETTDLVKYFKDLFMIPTLTFKEINDIFLDKTDQKVDFIIPSIRKFLLETLCYPIAIIIALQSLEVADAKLDNNIAIIESLEQFFTDIGANEIAAPSVTIDALNTPTIIEKRIENIVKSDTNYKEKFDRIMAMDSMTINERLTKIVNLGITSYENIFNYLLNETYVDINETLAIIINSNITTYENIFDYILSLDDLKMYDKMDYIINSNIVDYRELFTYITDYKNFTIREKIWYSLLIPNVEFEMVFNDLLNLNEYPDVIIKNIIDMDLIPFTSLFNSILKMNVISNKQLIEYLSYYNNHSNYNALTLEEIVNYVFNIHKLNLNEQVDCVWGLLENYPLDKREEFVLGYFNITKDSFLELYGINTIKLTEKEKVILDLFERIIREKEAFILEHYDFESLEQIKTTIAIVAAEGWRDYNDLYWVSNTIYNRVTSPRYIYMGTNPYDQATCPRQFVVYEKGLYKDFLNPTNIANIKQAAIARVAFTDMFFSQEIKHDYVQFRAWGSNPNFSSEYVVKHGNLYGVKMESRIDNQLEEEINTEEVVTRKLFLNKTYEE